MEQVPYKEELSLLPTKHQCDVNFHSTATDYHSDENCTTVPADLKIKLVWAQREGKGKERFPKIGCAKCFHFLFLRWCRLCWYQKDFNLLNLFVMLASRFAVFTDRLTLSCLWTHPCVIKQSRACIKKLLVVTVIEYHHEQKWEQSCWTVKTRRKRETFDSNYNRTKHLLQWEQKIIHFLWNWDGNKSTPATNGKQSVLSNRSPKWVVFLHPWIEAHY